MGYVLYLVLGFFFLIPLAWLPVSEGWYALILSIVLFGPLVCYKVWPIYRVLRASRTLDPRLAAWAREAPPAQISIPVPVPELQVLAFNSDCTGLVAVSGRWLRRWQLDQGVELSSWLRGGPFDAIAAGPGGAPIVVLRGGRVALQNKWGRRNWLPPLNAQHVALSPDGTLLAVTGRGYLELFAVSGPTSHGLHQIVRPDNLAAEPMFSPDSRSLAVHIGTGFGVLDTATGRLRLGADGERPPDFLRPERSGQTWLGEAARHSSGGVTTRYEANIVDFDDLDPGSSTYSYTVSVFTRPHGDRTVDSWSDGDVDLQALELSTDGVYLAWHRSELLQLLRHAPGGALESA